MMSHAAFRSGPEQRTLQLLAKDRLRVVINLARHFAKVSPGCENLIANAIRYKQNEISVRNLLDNVWSAAFIVRLVQIAFIFRQSINIIQFITFYWPGSGDMAQVYESASVGCKAVQHPVVQILFAVLVLRAIFLYTFDVVSVPNFRLTELILVDCWVIKVLQVRVNHCED